MDLGLNDVHVLVTGASGGIGLETASLFLRQGARVTGHFNSNNQSLQSLLKEYGPQKAQAIGGNLVLEDDVVRLFTNATESFGPVQVVVINHAMYPAEDVPLVDMSLERWKRTMDVNLNSTFLVAREFLRGLRSASEEQKSCACIILIGSNAGKIGEAGHADYASSKSAMMYGLTLSLKNEIVKIAPRGRVNAIGPSWIVTPMAEESLKDPVVAYQALATNPLKKVGAPSDVAGQIVVLSSPVISCHVTGEVLMITGGVEGRVLNMKEDLPI